MMQAILKHCLFCQDREELKELYPKNFQDEDLTPAVFSARRFSDRFHYQIVRCKKCGLVFSREILSDKVLSGLYAGSKVTFGEYADIIRKDYLRALKPYLKQIDKDSALEIGCSDGFFLEELLSQGFRTVYGCEPSLEAREKAKTAIKTNIQSEFFSAGMYEKNRFDLVCSFQTLDHLSDPAEKILICHEILKPGGMAYFIVHDVDSLQAHLLREKSPIMDVEHIYLFNKKTLRRLFEEANFKVFEVGEVKNSYPLSYWIKLFFKESWLGFFFMYIVKGLHLDFIGFPVAAGNIYIIAGK